VVGSYVPFWERVGGRQYVTFSFGVVGRQLCAILVGDWW
jgi:hypothetical protein